ncbi:MAG: hypothetical protein WAN17_00560 [Candidatus Sulfotelmatobacter sp.]
MLRIFQCRLRVALALYFFVTQASAVAATKSHVITFGKWITVQWSPESGAADEKPLTLKVRPLLVDSHVKEFTLGPAHDITDRLFVVRRAFRLNDSLPQESTTMPQWEWQRGGWLLVDHATSHISLINLPEFDVFYSAVSWYRDYAAYCGVSDDQKKAYAVVAEINHRMPILKKPIEIASNASKDTKDVPADPACPAPVWQRTPARVTFQPAGAPKQTFAIRGHVVDLMTEEEDDEEAAK